MSNEKDHGMTWRNKFSHTMRQAKQNTFSKNPDKWISNYKLDLLLLLSHFSRVRPTLCDPIDSSPPGSPVPGILQARTLEWVAISFSRPWKWKVKVKLLSRVWLLATPWTATYQAPPSMGFSRQEYWSGLPLPSPTNSQSLLKNSGSLLK